MALVTRGAGRPDYSADSLIQNLVNKFSGTQKIWGGSITVRGFIGSIDQMGTLRSVMRLGSLHYMERLGSIGPIGSIKAAVRLGSLHYQERLGSIGHVGSQPYLGYLGSARVRSGSIRNTFAGQDVLVGVDIQSRYSRGTVIRDRVRLGAGSTWLGSWQHVGSYGMKTFLFKVGNPGTTGGGSVAIITGLQGTRASDGTGTYFGPVRIGKGSYTPLSFTEAFLYARPWIRQHGAGAVAEHGGTVSFHLGLRT